jgi:hypothetical protein
MIIILICLLQATLVIVLRFGDIPQPVGSCEDRCDFRALDITQQRSEYSRVRNRAPEQSQIAVRVPPARKPLCVIEQTVTAL